MGGRRGEREERGVRWRGGGDGEGGEGSEMEGRGKREGNKYQDCGKQQMTHAKHTHQGQMRTPFYGHVAVA